MMSVVRISHSLPPGLGLKRTDGCHRPTCVQAKLLLPLLPESFLSSITYFTAATCDLRMDLSEEEDGDAKSANTRGKQCDWNVTTSARPHLVTKTRLV